MADKIEYRTQTLYTFDTETSHMHQSRLQHEYLCVFAGCMAYLINGYQWGYLGPALVILRTDGYYEIPPISSNSQSWMVTWLSIGFTPGAFCASYANDLFGRKYSLLLTVIPNLLAHLCTFFAWHINVFYLSEFIRGFYVGWITVIIPTYVSEIANPKLRGSFSAMGVAFQTIGSRCFASIIQSVTSIETTALIGIAITLIVLPLYFSISESPYYYLLKKKDTKCIQVLQRLRNTQNVEKEFEEMQLTFISNHQIKKSTSWFKLVTVPLNLRVTFITAGVLTSLHFSGQIPLSHYAHQILNTSGLNLSLFTISIIISATHIIPNLFSVFLIDSWGRKPLLILLCSLSATGHFMIALSKFLMDNTDINLTKLLGIFQFIGILFFEIAVGLGFVHMPFVLASELYSTEIKSKGTSFLKILASAEGVFVVQMFGLLTNINQCIPFFCMAVASTIGIVFGIILVPETKRKSLAKIQKDLHS